MGSEYEIEVNITLVRQIRARHRTLTKTRHSTPSPRSTRTPPPLGYVPMFSKIISIIDLDILTCSSCRTKKIVLEKTK